MLSARRYVTYPDPSKALGNRRFGRTLTKRFSDTCQVRENLFKKARLHYVFVFMLFFFPDVACLDAEERPAADRPLDGHPEHVPNSGQ